ncbi:MAG: TolC family protein, partial [Gemmataceae bacterium]|nr:TolC family protein [Gemmataceae bacterium]
RSFFQYKDAVQELVRGVAEAYWNLAQARTERWARQIQTDVSEEQFRREEARLKLGLANRGDEAQARLTYHQFRSALVAAQALVLAREGALRNLLGLAPSDGRAIVPSSPPASLRYKQDWKALVKLAEERRPDIIELKLILEADQQRLLQAENRALPRLDAQALYRWNGLEGEAPNGQRVSGGPGQFTDWTLAVNFSVPLGLREGRARVRQASLVIARDRANLDQGLHNAAHAVAVTVRDLDSAYQQYLALRLTRQAASENLEVQIANRRIGRAIYLDTLRALQAWGDAVNAESAALLSYNTQLANLERQTGTILETHGLVFAEERFQAAGPLGKHFPREYPGSVSAVGDPKRYPPDEVKENALGLKRPDLGKAMEGLPLPRKEK